MSLVRALPVAAAPQNDGQNMHAVFMERKKNNNSQNCCHKSVQKMPQNKTQNNEYFNLTPYDVSLYINYLHIWVTSENRLKFIVAEILDI